MELRAYLRIAGRYWWIVALAMLAAGAGAILYDTVRKPEYSGSTTVVVRSSPGISDSVTLVNLMGELGDSYVAGTYIQAFTSRPVMDAARLSIGLSADEANRYSLQASALPNTVVIEVSGKGPDPTVLRKYLDATVNATVNSTRTLFGVVELQPLEPAAVPRTPTSPQPIPDTSLAVGLGSVLGILLAMSLHYLRAPLSAGQEAALQGVQQVSGAREARLSYWLQFDRRPGEK